MSLRNHTRPIDLTGVRSSHRIDEEKHVVSVINRYIQLHHGAFFTEGLVLKYQGQPLEVIRDYRFVAMEEDAVLETGKDVATMIRIMNEHVVGEVSISYQMVGGKYENISTVLAEMLQSGKRDGNIPRFADLPDAPHEIFPKRHLHHWRDVYGFNPMVSVLTEVAELMKYRIIGDNSVFKRQLASMATRVANLPKLSAAEFEVLVNQVNGYNQRFDEMGTTLDTSLSAFRNTIETSRGLMTTQLDGMEQQLATGLSSLNETIGGHTTQLSSLTQRLDTLANENTQASVRRVRFFNTPQDQYLQLEPEGLHGFVLKCYRDPVLNDAVQQIAALERNLTTERGNIGDLQTALQQANTRLGGLTDSVTTVNQTLETLSLDTNNLLQKNQQQDASISGLQDQLNQLNESMLDKVQQLTEKDGELGTSLSEQQLQLGNLQSTLTALSDTLNQEVAKFGDMKSSLLTALREGDEGITASIEEKLSPVRLAVEDIRTQYQVATQSLSQLRENLTQNEREVTEIKRQLNELTTTFTEQKTLLSQQIEAVDDKVDAIAEWKTTADQTIQQHGNDITDIRGLQTSMSGSIVANERRITGLESRVTQVQSQASQTATDFDQFKQAQEAKNTEDDSRHRQITSDLGNLQSEFGRISASTEKAATAMGELSKTVSSQAEQIQEAVTNSRSYENRMQEIESTLNVSRQGDNTLGNRLSTLEDAHREFKSTMTRDHQSLQEQLHGVDEKATDVSNKVSELEQALNEKGDKISELERDAGTLRQSITTNAQTALEQLNTAKQTLQGKIDTTNENVTSLQQEVGTIKEKQRTDGESLIRLSGQLSSFKEGAESRLDGHDEQLRGLLTSRQQDQSAFEKLKSTVGTLNESLASVTSSIPTVQRELTQAIETAKEGIPNTVTTVATPLIEEKLTPVVQRLQTVESSLPGVTSRLDTQGQTLTNQADQIGELRQELGGVKTKQTQNEGALEQAKATARAASETASTLAVQLNMYRRTNDVAVQQAKAKADKVEERLAEHRRFRISTTGNGHWEIHRPSYEKYSVTLQNSHVLLYPLKEGNHNATTYDVDALDVPMSQATIPSVISNNLTENNPVLMVIRFTGTQSLPVLSSNEEAIAYVRRLELFMMLSRITHQTDRLVNILKGFYQGIQLGQSATLYLLFSNDGHNSINATVHYGESTHKYDIVVHRINEEGNRAAVFEEDLTQVIQYNSMLSNFLHDRYLRNNYANYLSNGNMIYVNGTVPGWTLLERGGQPVSEESKRRIFEDRSLCNLIGLQYMNDTTIQSQASFVLPAGTTQKLLEVTMSTTNPYRDVVFELEEMSDPQTGTGTKIRFERIRAFKTPEDVAVVPRRNDAVYRIKFVSPPISTQQTDKRYRLVMSVSGALEGERFGHLCLTDLRGTNTYIPSDDSLIAVRGYLDEDFIGRIQSEVRRYITEHTQPSSASRWDLSRFDEQPGAEDWTEVTTDEFDNLRATGVVLHKTASDDQGAVVFTPTTTYHITESNTWRVPVHLRGRKAEVTIRAASLMQGGQIINSAVRHVYIDLPTEGTIDVVVGALTSFGRYLTVNNNQDYPDAIYPRSIGLSAQGGLVTITV